MHSSLIYASLLIAAILVLIRPIQSSREKSVVETYIESKFREKREYLLNEVYTQEEFDHEADWSKLWSSSLQTTRRPRAASFSGDDVQRAYLVDGGGLLYSVSTQSSSPPRPANDPIQLNGFTPYEPVRFVKSHNWRGTLFLLVCQSRACSLYHGRGDVAQLPFDSVQLLHNHGLLVVDACFVARRDRFFLLVPYSDANDADAQPTM